VILDLEIEREDYSYEKESRLGDEHTFLQLVKRQKSGDSNSAATVMLIS
jgi:hypothetical protein